MKFNETTASKCRWSESVEVNWGDWDFLWEDSYADYQGHVRFIAEKDGRYVYYEYYYGSCSGCDSWEDFFPYDDPVPLANEMSDSALYFDNKAELAAYRDRIVEQTQGKPRWEEGQKKLAGLYSILKED